MVLRTIREVEYSGGSGPSFRDVMDVVRSAELTDDAEDRGIEIQRIPGDGSDRQFFRMRKKDFHCVVLISPRREGCGIDENDSYFRVGKHLYSAGIPVPKILWADAARGCFVLEDVGDLHLQKYANRGRAEPLALYRKVLRLLAALHRKAPVGFESDFCFDRDLYDAPFIYERELEYFRKSFLVRYLGLDVSSEDLRTDFERLAEDAGWRDRSLVMHRDFQSRNVMVYRGGLRLIDFQGMRFGPPHYDLASLLIDPYVHLARNTQAALVELYWTACRDFLGGSSSEFRNKYTVVRLCRNLQILGAFGHLGVVGNKPQFLQYVPGAWRALVGWLDDCCRGRYPQIERWIGLAVRLKKPVLQGSGPGRVSRMRGNESG